MTVKELIEELQHYKPDTTVEILQIAEEYNYYRDVISVDGGRDQKTGEARVFIKGI